MHFSALEMTYSASNSATGHLYWAFVNKQMSATCRTEILIFLTAFDELLVTCTLTLIVSP